MAVAVCPSLPATPTGIKAPCPYPQDGTAFRKTTAVSTKIAAITVFESPARMAKVLVRALGSVAVSSKPSCRQETRMVLVAGEDDLAVRSYISKMNCPSW